MGPRITTWNVNGIRNPFGYQPWRDKKTLQAMFDVLESDIVVMQETKIQRKDLQDDMVLVPGWDAFFSLPKHKKGYSGVAIFTRNSVCAPIRAEEGITGILCPPNSPTSFCDLPRDQQIGGYPSVDQLAGYPVDAATLDGEGRCVILEFPAFVLIGVYSPAHRDESRDDFRLGFLNALDARVRNLVALGKSVLLTGDLNIIRDEIDTANIEERLRKHGMTEQEFMSTPSRRLLNQLLEGGRVIGDNEGAPVLWDICRGFHPGRKGMFTCWETKINARPGNFGSRIDYVLCSLDLKDWFRDSNIQEGLLGSDHCPVYAVVKDTVEIDGVAVHIEDVMNPPGVFKDGVRQRGNAKLLSTSARLIPEFDRRRSIRDMFANVERQKSSVQGRLETSGRLDAKLIPEFDRRQSIRDMLTSTYVQTSNESSVQTSNESSVQQTSSSVQQTSSSVQQTSSSVQQTSNESSVQQTRKPSGLDVQTSVHTGGLDTPMPPPIHTGSKGLDAMQTSNERQKSTSVHTGSLVAMQTSKNERKSDTSMMQTSVYTERLDAPMLPPIHTGSKGLDAPMQTSVHAGRGLDAPMSMPPIHTGSKGLDASIQNISSIHKAPDASIQNMTSIHTSTGSRGPMHASPIRTSTGPDAPIHVSPIHTSREPDTPNTSPIPTSREPAPIQNTSPHTGRAPDAAMQNYTSTRSRPPVQDTPIHTSAGRGPDAPQVSTPTGSRADALNMSSIRPSTSIAPDPTQNTPSTAIDPTQNTLRASTTTASPVLDPTPPKTKHQTESPEPPPMKRGRSGPSNPKGQTSLKGFFKPKVEVIPASFDSFDTFSLSTSTQTESRGLESPPFKGQSSLKGFKPETIPPSFDSQASSSSLSTPSTQTETRGLESKMEHQQDVIDPIVAKESWSRLLSKRVVPRCDHHEPCISYVTKKPGVNCGRSFYMCQRPLGPSGQKERGTEWRCGTFIWSSDWGGNGGGGGQV